MGYYIQERRQTAHLLLHMYVHTGVELVIDAIASSGGRCNRVTYDAWMVVS